MRDMSADELARACAATMYKSDFAAQEAGISIVEVKEAYAVMKMAVKPEMMNGHGVCHGGLIFMLADTAFAYACNSRNDINLAQSCTIDFVLPGRAGEELTAVAEQCAQTGRTGLYDVQIKRPGGEVIAYFRGRSYQVKGKTLID